MTFSPAKLLYWPRARESLVRCGLLLVLVALSLGAGLSGTSASEYRPTPKVLILNSYHPGFTWSDEELTGVLRELHQRYPDLTPAIEYLDTKHFPSEAHLLQEKDYLARKYQGHKFDLVVVLDDSALKMILAHRAELFPETPVVFAGINNTELAMLAGQKKMTGNTESLEIEGTFKMILAFHPDTTEIFVVTDNTVTGKAARKQIEAILPRLPAGLQVKFAPPATMAELVDQIKNLPATAVVFLLGFATDTAGQTFSTAESAHRLTDAAKVPVYIVHASRLGYGPVGGMLLAGREEGRLAGGIALRVLAGEDPASIPVGRKSNARPMFDYRQLTRFKIPESALPAGSTVMNRPSSFYGVHKSLLWGLLGVVLALALVVMVLSIYIRRQRRAEASLRESEGRFRTLVESISLGITLIGTDYRIIMANSAQAKLFQKTAGELVGQECFRVFEKRDAVCSHCPGTVAMATGTKAEVETQGFLNDGSVVTSRVQAFPRFGPEGQPLGFIEVVEDVTPRKQLEKDYKYQLDFLQNLLDTMPNLVFYKDVKGVYQGCNQAMEEFLGLSKEEIIGKTVFDIYPEDLAKKYEAMDRDLFLHPGTQTYEFDMARSDGSRRRFIFTKATFLDPEGRLGGLIGVMTDITERNRAAEALKRLNDRHQLILSSAAEGILGLDPQGKHTFVNAAAAKMLGYEAQELIGAPSHATWHHTRLNGNPLPEAECPISRTLEQGTSYFGADEVFWRKDGTSFPVDYATAPIIEDGQMTGSVVTFWDISQRREVEEAFTSLVSHAPMGIFIIQDGKYMVVNPGFETITGYCKEELLGRESNCLATPHLKDKVRKEAIKRLKGETCTPFEFQFITKSGQTRWGIETIIPTQFEGKRATLGYFMDVTEYKQLEEQSLQAEKMESLGALAGGLAHDFNNILTAVLGNIGLAALDDKIAPRVKDRLAQAEAACLRAQALSQQLLAFAKGGAPVKKLLSLAELLTETTAFACIGSAVKCETSFPENLWSIEADPGQIGQVVQNLTINAIQAMPAGGTVTVRAENLSLETDSELPLTPGKYVKVFVRDQGIGILPEHLPRIFDPYFTTKHKGSGLGLASTYSIIKNHHGHIAVESTIGMGTTFKIFLPAVDRQVPPQPQEERELLVGKGRILVMDDEDMVREVSGKMLARLGYEAEFARNGGEAIEMFVQAHASEQAFAGVILDLTIPGGIGGKETMARLLEVDPQVKAIVSSGYSDDPIMADFEKYGFDGVIVKPYRISEFAKILHDVVMKK